MALNLSNKYPGRANPPSIDYPEGSIKNQTAPGAKDGTPLDADWANDKEGFFQSILSYRGVAASGDADKVGDSQYFDAITASPTESLKGMAQIATNSEAQSFESDEKIITPLKLKAAFSGGNFNSSVSGYQRLPSGLILQWGSAAIVAGGSASIITLPVTFSSIVLAVSYCRSATSAQTPNESTIVVNPELHRLIFRSPVATTSASSFYWFAIGV